MFSSCRADFIYSEPQIIVDRIMGNVFDAA